MRHRVAQKYLATGESFKAGSWQLTDLPVVEQYVLIVQFDTSVI